MYSFCWSQPFYSSFRLSSSIFSSVSVDIHYLWVYFFVPSTCWHEGVTASLTMTTFHLPMTVSSSISFSKIWNLLLNVILNSFWFVFISQECSVVHFLLFHWLPRCSLVSFGKKNQQMLIWSNICTCMTLVSSSNLLNSLICTHDQSGFLFLDQMISKLLCQCTCGGNASFNDKVVACTHVNKSLHCHSSLILHVPLPHGPASSFVRHKLRQSYI